MDSERSMADFHFDYHYKPEIYLAMDAGYFKAELDRNNLDYFTNGLYFSFGADKNLMKAELAGDLDIAFAGLRYGFSVFKHSSDSIFIDNYWGDYNGSLEQRSLYAHWIEAVGGMKAELFFAKNFFIGWTFRFKFKLFGKKDEQMPPWYIPGFGMGDKKSAFGFNWSLYYRIPFN